MLNRSSNQFGINFSLIVVPVTMIVVIIFQAHLPVSTLSHLTIVAIPVAIILYSFLFLLNKKFKIPYSICQERRYLQNLPSSFWRKPAFKRLLTTGQRTLFLNIYYVILISVSWYSSIGDRESFSKFSNFLALLLAAYIVLDVATDAAISRKAKDDTTAP